MKILYSKEFLKSAKKLPQNIKRKLAYLLEVMKEDPLHPKLHAKTSLWQIKRILFFQNHKRMESYFPKLFKN